MRSRAGARPRRGRWAVKIIITGFPETRPPYIMLFKPSACGAARKHLDLKKSMPDAQHTSHFSPWASPGLCARSLPRPPSRAVCCSILAREQAALDKDAVMPSALQNRFLSPAPGHFELMSCHAGDRCAGFARRPRENATLEDA